MSKDSPFSYSKNSELHNIYDNLIKLQKKEDLLVEREAKIAGLEAEGGLSFKPLNNVSLPSMDLSHYTHSESGWGDRRKIDIDSVKKRVEAVIANLTEENKLIREKNAPLIAHNESVKNSVISLMTKLGASDYVTYEYPTSRSRTKKEVRHEAGYKADLRRLMPKSNVDVAEAGVKRLKESLDQYIKKEEELGKKEAEQKAKEIAAQDGPDLDALIKNTSLIESLKSVGVDVLASVSSRGKSSVRSVVKLCKEEGLFKILESNKYLKLAHYMLENRNDWSDGYSLAEIGLNSFTIESELDKAIHDDIADRIENWDGDGRVFRDTEYNYDKLFAMVDDSLLLSYRTIRESIS